MRKRKPKYYIHLAGIQSNSIYDVILDNSYTLRQLYPNNKAKHPEFSEMVLYTNILSYLHDTPAYFSSTDKRVKKAPVTPIFASKNRDHSDNFSYHKNLDLALSAIANIRFGKGQVYINWDEYSTNNIIVINTNRYKKASEEISLYTMALKQTDPLSEYLNYYRVIESTGGNNAIDWIEKNIDRINNYSFGKLFVQDSLNSKTKNLWVTYKRKALYRINQLKTKKNKNEIADYFFKINRLGVTLGNENSFDQNITINLKEIVKDMFVLKLLARIEIDDKKNVIFT